MSSLTEIMPIIDKMSEHLSKAEMRAAVIATPWQNTEGRPVQLHATLSDMFNARLFAVNIIRTAQDYGILPGQVEEVMDAAIARKYDVAAHKETCQAELVEIFRAQGVEADAATQQAIRTTLDNFADTLRESMRPPVKESTWVSRTQDDAPGSGPRI